MLSATFEFKAKLYSSEFEGGFSWVSLNLPKKDTETIIDLLFDESDTWGSVNVNVTIGKTKWKTTMYPDGDKFQYILPVKENVRKAEKIDLGDMVNCEVEIEL